MRFLLVVLLVFLFAKANEEDRVKTLIRELMAQERGECFEVVATAYSNDPVSINVPKWRDGLTSTLAKADRGTVAVDPRVIPYGSVIYVQGYGYAVALDKGSAIKGYRIDLFFETRQKALKWGVKRVTVCILGRINHENARATAKL